MTAIENERTLRGALAAERAREVHELCRRVLGSGPGADEAAAAALADGDGGRIVLLARAGRECRVRVDSDLDRIDAVAPPVPGSMSFADAVAAEVAAANQALPGRQREAMALRELMRLSYAQIGEVMSLGPSAVASLLARARLALRAELRGTVPVPVRRCAERERALRVLARRQDSEALDALDDIWIRDHLAACPDCERAHGAMLEATVRYRAWGRS